MSEISNSDYGRATIASGEHALELAKAAGQIQRMREEQFAKNADAARQINARIKQAIGSEIKSSREDGVFEINAGAMTAMALGLMPPGL